MKVLQVTIEGLDGNATTLVTKFNLTTTRKNVNYGFIEFIFNPVVKYFENQTKQIEICHGFDLIYKGKVIFKDYAVYYDHYKTNPLTCSFSIEEVIEEENNGTL